MDYLKKSLLTQKDKSVDTQTDNLLTDLLECRDLLNIINNLGVYEKDIDSNSPSYNDERSSSL
jgi:hypothetical protein